MGRVLSLCREKLREMTMIQLRDSHHRYNSGTEVNLPDLQVEKGEHLLILGLSGSGKSTLLHILAGILRPTKGSYLIDRTDLYSLSESQRDQFRGRHIGVIFQQMHLINSLTVKENLKLAQYMAGHKPDDSKVIRICSELDISDKVDTYTDELSQGQKQRVSIARAVMNDPLLLLADEPTSSLDDIRSGEVLSLLKSQAKRTGATLIISTHDQRVKDQFPNRVELDAQNQEEV